EPSAHSPPGMAFCQNRVGLRIAERRDMFTERADQLLAFRIVQRAIPPQESKHHYPLEAGQYGNVWCWFAQHIAHPVTQGVTRVHRAEEVSLQGNVIPLHTGVILHTSS